MAYVNVVVDAFPQLSKTAKRKITSAQNYVDVIQILSEDMISIIDNHLNESIALDFGKSVFTEESVVSTLVYLEKLGLNLISYVDEKTHFYVYAEM